MKNILLLGPPGSGKGTQAQKLQAHYQLTYLATGSLFRKHIKKQTVLGKKAWAYINQGQLVPDVITIEIMNQKLRQLKKGEHFILDGYPRSISQGEALAKQLQTTGHNLDLVIYIEVAKEIVIKRISSRLTCLKCQQVFSAASDKLKAGSPCPNCAGFLAIRSDDTKAKVTSRIEEYTSKTQPLISYYQKQKKLVTINGHQPITKIFQEIKEHISE